MARILVIDDEADTLDLIRILLEGAGYEVRTCDSGKRAWNAIMESHPDLVIMDVILPGVDGYSLQNQMHQENATTQIPVLILTALEPSRTLFDKSPNVAGFMTKPFRSEDLLAKIKLALVANSK